jgi:hypothetical protein
MAPNPIARARVAAPARLLVSASLVLGFGCSGPSAESEPPADAPYVGPAEHCDGLDPANATRFTACSTGSGIFGRWTVDDSSGAGALPAYDYGLDENADERARFTNTERLDRRDHVFQFGNRRVTAYASNDGPIEIVTQDRGMTYLNKVDEDAMNLGGGFGYLDDGDAIWSSAYKWRPRGSKTTRRFGMTHASSSMLHRGVQTSRSTFAPGGEAADTPAVVTEVTLENTTSAPKTLRYYEYWDAGRLAIETQWVVSGAAVSGLPARVRAQRDEANALFDETVSWDPARQMLRVHREPKVAAASAAAVSPKNDFPEDTFLAALDAPVDRIFTEQDAFFGSGTPVRPETVAARATGASARAPWTSPARTGKGQGRALVLETDVTLLPGQRKTLRYAFGYQPHAAAVDALADSVEKTLAASAAAKKAQAASALLPHLFHYIDASEPALHREMAWHTSQLEASVAYRSYWGAHVVPQGSAYLTLHGADGALRDIFLFALPLTFTDAALAKEQLRLGMGMQFAADGRFSYAFQGHGVLDAALDLHAKPSDQDLFFLWALVEYVGATGDAAFLDERAPFYPRESKPTATVWDHVVASVRHLLDVVGRGPHGLVRVGTGDWSDGIVQFAPNRETAIASGESIPNTQMALYVLPRLAALVEARDAALAAELKTRAGELTVALKPTYNGTFYGRAYFGDDKLFHADELDLEAQVWPLIGDSLSRAEREKLAAVVFEKLDKPSPTGAALAEGGQVWPAISGLLTWGYRRLDEERAFAHLRKDTLLGHAGAYPDIWYGIWTGPDGTNGAAAPPRNFDKPRSGPGEAWFSIVTPMTDFPAFNNNAHAMPLLASLRALGVEGTASGILMAIPKRTVALQTELLDVAFSPGEARGTYRPRGARTLRLRAPDGAQIVSVTLNDADVPVVSASEVEVPVQGTTAFVARYR